MSVLELLDKMINYYNYNVELNDKYGLDMEERLDGMYEIITQAKKLIMKSVEDMAEDVGNE